MPNLVLINATLDFYAILITAVIAVMALMDKMRGQKLNRTFFLLCLMTILMLAGDASSWIFGGLNRLWYPWAAQVGTFLYYLAGFLCLGDFSYYVYLRVERWGKPSRAVLYTAAVVPAVGVVLLIISQFNHMFYYFDSTGIYQRGRWFLLSQMSLLVVFIVITGVILANRKSLPRHETVGLILYILIPMAAAVLQQFTYITIIFPAITLAVLLIFLSIQLEAMREIKNLSEHDALTNLLNRAKFDSLSRTEYRMLRSCGVIWFDVNNLKKTNDACGHIVGDQIIRLAADSIRSITNRRIHGYRMGGDEFLVVVCDGEEEEVEDLLQLWRERFKAMNETTRYPCSVAVGVAWAEGNFSLDELIRMADKEMYKDKHLAKKAQGTLGFC